jgi:hypothetical protein
MTFWLLVPCLAACSGNSGSDSTTSDSSIAWDLTFTPDPGIRVDNAAIPSAYVDDTGSVVLMYEDESTQPGSWKIKTASDGLIFFTSVDPAAVRHPYDVLMPDGRWRRYIWNPPSQQFTSETSSDRIHYTSDVGTRYALQPQDNGTMGIYDIFSDSAGGIVLLYIGDMYGMNNVRRAYSSDGGWTFAYTDGNVLGDDGAGGGPNSYVDQHCIRLPDGRRRLTCMRRTDIYSFLSTDDGKSFSADAGARILKSDFTELTVQSLNDPTMVLLPDGRYRIYVAALISKGAGTKWAILSATSDAPPES